MEFKNKCKVLKSVMKIAEMKFKYSSYICISAYLKNVVIRKNSFCVVTRTLKINLECNSSFLIIIRTLEKIWTMKNLYVNIWNLKINIKYLK